MGAKRAHAAGDDGTDEVFFKHGSDEQLRFIAPLQLERDRVIDATSVSGRTTNTRNLTGVDPQRQRSGARPLVTI